MSIPCFGIYFLIDIPMGCSTRGSSNRWNDLSHREPSRASPLGASLLEEMFESQPVALILDEFQKWFDGLHDESGATGRKWRESASNFIQNLSEIAKDRPDILLLVVSVLNNNTDAYELPRPAARGRGN